MNYRLMLHERNTEQTRDTDRARTKNGLEPCLAPHALRQKRAKANRMSPISAKLLPHQ